MKKVNPLVVGLFFNINFADAVEFRRKHPPEVSSLHKLKGKSNFCRNSPIKQS